MQFQMPAHRNLCRLSATRIPITTQLITSQRHLLLPTGLCNANYCLQLHLLLTPHTPPQALPWPRAGMSSRGSAGPNRSPCPPCECPVLMSQPCSSATHQAVCCHRQHLVPVWIGQPSATASIHGNQMGPANRIKVHSNSPKLA